MSYGTVRNHARKTIISALNEHEKLRYGELETIVIDEKKACSDRIFRETLAEIVENKSVKKYIIARNNTLYTINSEITPISDKEIDVMIKAIENVKEGTKSILQIISSDAVDMTKTEEVMKYLHWVSTYEMQLMILSRVAGKRKLTRMAKEFPSYKKQILDSLSVKGSSSISTLGSLVFGRLFVESFRLDPEMLKMFIKDFTEVAKELKKKR